MRKGIPGRCPRWCWKPPRTAGVSRPPRAAGRPAWPSGGSSSSAMADAPASVAASGPVFPHPAAVVPVGDWQLAHATGNDRIAFLHRLVTGRIEGLSPGEGARALLLTVKGHIVSDLRVAADADRVHLVMPP